MHYNKHITAGLLLVSAAAVAGNKHHVIINGGMVHLRGVITAPGCAVSIASQNQTVDMGTVRSNQFTGPGSYAPPVPFIVSLVGCSRAVYQHVGTSFWGVTDGKDPLVLQSGNGLDAVPGVGLAIFDSHGELMVPNSAPRGFTQLNDGSVNLHFTARYRATAYQVTGGSADTWSWFTLTYQ